MGHFIILERNFESSFSFLDRIVILGMQFQKVSPYVGLYIHLLINDFEQKI